MVFFHTKSSKSGVFCTYSTSQVGPATFQYGAALCAQWPWHWAAQLFHMQSLTGCSQEAILHTLAVIHGFFFCNGFLEIMHVFNQKKWLLMRTFCQTAFQRRFSVVPIYLLGIWPCGFLDLSEGGPCIYCLWSNTAARVPLGESQTGCEASSGAEHMDF